MKTYQEDRQVNADKCDRNTTFRTDRRYTGPRVESAHYGNSWKLRMIFRLEDMALKDMKRLAHKKLCSGMQRYNGSGPASMRGFFDSPQGCTGHLSAG